VHCLATILVVCCLAEEQHEATEDNVASVAMHSTHAVDQIVPDSSNKVGPRDGSAASLSSAMEDQRNRRSKQASKIRKKHQKPYDKGPSLRARVLAVAKKAALSAASLEVSKKGTLAQVTAASSAAAKRATWDFVKKHAEERSEAVFRASLAMARKEGRSAAYASAVAHKAKAAAMQQTFRKVKSYKQRLAERKSAREVRSAAQAHRAKLLVAQAQSNKAKAKLERSIGLLKKYITDNHQASYSSVALTKRGQLVVNEKLVKAKTRHLQEQVAKAKQKANLAREISRKHSRRSVTKKVAEVKQQQYRKFNAMKLKMRRTTQKLKKSLRKAKQDLHAQKQMSDASATLNKVARFDRLKGGLAKLRPMKAWLERYAGQS